MLLQSFFGFANCPDICPTTLVELKEIDKRINNKNFKVLFVTLDPDRDTQEVLKIIWHLLISLLLD